jgi:hypothetical protein
MRAVLAALNAMFTTVSALLLFNWATMPAALPYPAASQHFGEVKVSSARKRVVVALLPTQDSEVFTTVNCEIVATLCAELKSRPIQGLEVWLASPGFLAGDWIVRAKEGQKEWVTVEDQNAQFKWMYKFYAMAAVLMSALALVTGYFAFFRKKS